LCRFFAVKACHTGTNIVRYNIIVMHLSPICKEHYVNNCLPEKFTDRNRKLPKCNLHFRSFVNIVLSLYSSASVAAGQLLYLRNTYTVEVTLYRMLKCRCRYRKLDSRLRILAGKK